MATKTQAPIIHEPYVEYRGNGAFVQGVPARDLTKTEWDALTDEQKEAAAPLYTLAAVTPQE